MHFSFYKTKAINMPSQCNPEHLNVNNLKNVMSFINSGSVIAIGPLRVCLNAMESLKSH